MSTVLGIIFGIVVFLILGHIGSKDLDKKKAEEKRMRQEQSTEADSQLTDEQRAIVQKAEALAARQAQKEQAEAARRAQIQSELDLSSKLTMTSEPGKTIIDCLSGNMGKDLRELLEMYAAAYQSWQSVFILWLVHYIGFGTEPDPVENKDIPEYLDDGLFRKAYDMAPQESRKLLDSFKSNLGSGINCTPLHSHDTRAQVRMRGLFNAVASVDFADGSARPAGTTDLVASGTLLYESIRDEAIFWMSLFSAFPGVDSSDPDKVFITKYFASFAQDTFAETVRRECLDALDRSARGEQALPGDDLKHMVVNIGYDPAHNADPCYNLLADRSDAEKMLPQVNGAFLGNAACMLSMAFLTRNPKTRQDMDSFLREYHQHDLAWGIERLKALLDAQDKKGNPVANILKDMIQDT